MKEAGYKWDADKKELKEIEKKPSEWGEEDEQYLLVCKNALIKYQHSDQWDANIISRWLENRVKSLKDRMWLQPKQEWSENDKEQLDRAIYMMEQLDMTKSWDDVYNWLKSLKPQNIKRRDV